MWKHLPPVVCPWFLFFFLLLISPDVVNDISSPLSCQVTRAPCRLSWSSKKPCVSTNSTRTLSSLSTVSLCAFVRLHLTGCSRVEFTVRRWLSLLAGQRPMTSRLSFLLQTSPLASLGNFLWPVKLCLLATLFAISWTVAKDYEDDFCVKSSISVFQNKVLRTHLVLQSWKKLSQFNM